MSINDRIRCVGCVSYSHGFGEVEKIIEKLFQDIVLTIPQSVERALRGIKTEPIIYAIMGDIGYVFSNLERRIMTKFGIVAPELVKPWFLSCDAVAKPFDLLCFSDNIAYTIRVVSSVKAFNSTLRRRIESESARYVNPVILTMTGLFEGKNRSQQIGKALWFDAWASWYFLTCRRDGYKEFLRLLMRTGRKYRKKVLDTVFEKYRKYMSEYMAGRKKNK